MRLLTKNAMSRCSGQATKSPRGKWTFIAVMLMCLMGCSNNEADDEDLLPYDPAKPVRITGFTPEKGSGGDKFIIYGDNFGTDSSLVKLSINEVQGVIISVSNTSIYGFVPRKAESAPVVVTVGKGGDMQTAVSEKNFEYIPGLSVRTVAGFVDRDNNSNLVDGTLDVAQFKELFWFQFDKDCKELYIVEDRIGLRKLVLQPEEGKRQEVKTIFTGSDQQLGQIRAMQFSADYERLYFWNDQEAETGTGIAMATRTSPPNNPNDKDFRTPTTLLRQRNVCGGAIHPFLEHEQDVFYNRWGGGEYFRFNKEDYPNDTYFSKEMFRVENQFNSSLIFAPNGKFAYITSISHHCIYKVDYNEATGLLGGLRILCGQKGKAGYADGPGTKAQFNELKQGCFDEDNNFYICDANNQCIRKVTPEGLVSTYAGRGNDWGYVDGDARKEAKFNYPCAIAYNHATKEFYIGDRRNYRIRVVTTE